MRDWLLGVTCTAMALALMESLVPACSAKKVCRLAGGLALLLAAVSPILSLDENALGDALADYRSSVEQYEETLAEQNDLLYKTIIEERTAAYIVDKAEEIGVFCQAEVTLAYEEDGTPYPWEVTARGVWRSGQREELSRLLETELGIPPERQYYEERQP